MLSRESERTDPLLDRRKESKSFLSTQTFLAFFACALFALALIYSNSNAAEEKVGAGTSGQPQPLPPPRLSGPLREPSEGYPADAPPSYASIQEQAKKWEDTLRFEKQQQAIADARREEFLRKQREAYKEYETLKAAQTPKLSATGTRAKLPQGMPPGPNAVQSNPAPATGGTRLYPQDLVVPGPPRKISNSASTQGTPVRFSSGNGVPGTYYPPQF